MLRVLRILLGHLAIVAVAIVIQKYDEALYSMGHTVHLVTPYVIVLCVGLWAALSVKPGSMLGVGVGALIWSIAWVVLLTVMIQHDKAVEPHARSEGGEFFVILAIVPFTILSSIGYGLGRLFQFICRRTLEMSSATDDKRSAEI